MALQRVLGRKHLVDQVSCMFFFGTVLVQVLTLHVFEFVFSSVDRCQFFRPVFVQVLTLHAYFNSANSIFVQLASGCAE